VYRSHSNICCYEDAQPPELFVGWAEVLCAKNKIKFYFENIEGRNHFGGLVVGGRV
jgi:hypothetical protein